VLTISSYFYIQDEQPSGTQKTTLRESEPTYPIIISIKNVLQVTETSVIAIRYFLLRTVMEISGHCTLSCLLI